MSKLFLFAVGGTGARVLRSFTMLIASGLQGFDSSTEIVPIIIDHDRQCGDKKRATDTLDTYQNINRALYPNGNTVSYVDHFFMTRVTPLSEVGAAHIPKHVGDSKWCLNFGPDGSVKFAEFIGIPSMVAMPGLTETLGLLHALYDSSDDTAPAAELELNLNVGFKGKPNIGTVVFHELKDTVEFQQFLACCAPNDKVFIVGSLFGGTGSSGIPEIVKAIRNSGAACANTQIGTALMLPYFGLLPNQHPNNDGLNTGAIDSAMFNAKTKAALGSYSIGGGDALNNMVNSIYYIGDEVNATSNEYNEGAVSQKNPAHVAEFIAAQAIVDFWVSGNAGPHEFGTRDDGQTKAFDLQAFHDVTHEQILTSLSVFTLAVRYYREVVRGERVKLNPTTTFYSSKGFDLAANLNKGIYALIDVFLGIPANNDWGFYPWLKELADQPHALKLYNIGTDSLNDILCHKVIKGGLISSPVTKDDNLNSKMNSITKNITSKDVTTFFKSLRTLGQEIYNIIK